MKKTLCALAIGATIASPVVFADVSIYGRAHVSLDWLDGTQAISAGTPPVVTKKDYSELNLSSNSSRLGFKGDTKLNDNLTAFVQVEQEINFAQGEGSTWASRDTFVGVKGDFGSIRAGQFDTPFKTARGPADFFGDQVGDMRNLTRGAGFDERSKNTIHYQTPNFDGLQANIALSLHNGAVAASDAKNEAFSGSVTYKKGALNTALAYENYAEDRGDRDAVRLAASYQVLPVLTLAAFAQMENNETTPDANVLGLSGEYKLTEKTALKGHYFVRDVDATDANSSLVAVGVEHRISSPFRVYANLATVQNDDNANLAPWRQARTTNVPSLAAGERTQALSLGVRYDF